MKHLLVALALLVALTAPSLAAIDELAFGTGPAHMVYLFVVDEVLTTPDSPYTAKRLENAVKFVQGKVSGTLIRHLVDLQTLIQERKFSKAKEKARKLKAVIYGE